MERNDYRYYPASEDFGVYSEVLCRYFYGKDVSEACHNRSEAERVYYQHTQKQEG